MIKPKIFDRIIRLVNHGFGLRESLNIIGYQKSIEEFKEILSIGQKSHIDNIKTTNDRAVTVSSKPILLCMKEYIDTKSSPTVIKRFESYMRVFILWLNVQNIDPQYYYCYHLNAKFKKLFLNFLISDRKIATYTAAKYFEFLYSFMDWASEKKYHNSLSYFKEFRISRVKSGHIDKNLTRLNRTDIEISKYIEFESELTTTPTPQRIEYVEYDVFYHHVRSNNLDRRRYGALQAQGLLPSNFPIDPIKAYYPTYNRKPAFMRIDREFVPYEVFCEYVRTNKLSSYQYKIMSKKFLLPDDFPSNPNTFYGDEYKANPAFKP